MVKYGNVIGSRGSAIPIFLEQSKAGNQLTITDPHMTRFMFTLDSAVALLVEAVEGKEKEYIAQCKSMVVYQIAETCWEMYNEKPMDFTVIGARLGEKKHEILGDLSSCDAERMTKEELRCLI